MASCSIKTDTCYSPGVIPKIKVNFRSYVSSLTREEMINRVATVLTTTGIGAGIGAAAGSTAGGIGAGPGAGIGAAVGFGTGMTMVAVWDSCEFYEWLNGLSIKARSDFIEKIGCMMGNTELRCPITLCIPSDAVRIPTAPNNVFERKALRKWIMQHGTCPITRAPIKVEDMRMDIGAISAVKKYCKAILDNTEALKQFSSEQQKGLKILQKESEKKLDKVVETEASTLCSQVKKKSINLKEFAARARELAESVDDDDVTIDFSF